MNERGCTDPDGVGPFAPLEVPRIPLYPVVDSADWVGRLFAWGLPLVQLRFKTRPGADARAEVAAAVAAGRRHGASVVINDAWELAIRHGAAGVHLGRARWADTDFEAIARAGLVLGMSVHDAGEIREALQHRPAYLTLGTVFPSPSKPAGHPTVGLAGVARLRPRVPCPLVAIGGITPDRAGAVLEAGADLVAVVSDLVGAPEPAARIRRWRAVLSRP